MYTSTEAIFIVASSPSFDGDGISTYLWDSPLQVTGASTYLEK